MTRAWLAMGLLLSSCVPWTTRPIENEKTSGTAFDANAFVDSVWDSKVMPAAAGAPDIAQVFGGGKAPPAGAVLVRGAGRVLRVDTTSRSGLMYVDVAPFDGRADAALQIGPVLRGTALRDALPFIQFSQFVNQLEFARVGNALNDRVWKSALAALPKDHLAGLTVTFAGAAVTAGGLAEVVPVKLEVTEASK
jgi:predicted lipoprotein